MTGFLDFALTPLFAGLVVAALLAALAALAWIRRGPEDTLLIALLRLVLDLYMRVFHRLHWMPPAAPIPLQGPAIVVANHRSGVDPLAVAASTRRLIHFLMAREYYEIPWLRWFFRLSGAIPVNRDGNDLGATKAALKILRDGELLGIFPQGGISLKAGEPLGGKSGAALLALKTEAPVVPAHITGTPSCESVLRALLTPSRSAVRFGEPVRFSPPLGRKPSREEVDALARQILERVEKLRPEHSPAAQPLRP